MSKLSYSEIVNNDTKFLFQNYGKRLPVAFTSGKGEYLYDTEGKEYIDFFAGIAVSSLGYAHPVLLKALHEQIDRVIHTSNWYFNPEQTEAARLVSSLSFKGYTLFSNSGTEANEAAIKLSRKFGLSISPEKYQIVSFTKSFHGRTFGSMTATGQEKIHKGFGPLVPGFIYLDFNDKDFASKIDSSKTCAVITELIQGEGGINIAGKEFIVNLSKFCSDNKILFIADEVQTGIGRTGTPFLYEQYGIVPDILTLAKGLGGGVPVGAMHAKENLLEHFPGGAHGSTFGGNHLACAAVSAVLSVVAEGKILDNVRNISSIMMKELESIKKKTGMIKEIRGVGLHIGVDLTTPGTELVHLALSEGLLINCTADTVIRIMPPLVIGKEAVEKGLEIFENILMKVKTGM